MFGRKKGPKDQLRQSKADVRDQLRELDRDLADMRKEEAHLTDEIRAAARAGNDASTRILAQQLVRLRDHIQRIQATRAGLTGISVSLATAASSAAAVGAMQKAGTAMGAMGAAVDPGKVLQDARAFARADAQQSALQEVMDGALDDALFTEGEDEEAGALVQQLLEEAGLQVEAAAPAAATGAVPARQQVAGGEDEELSRKLDALRAA